MQTIKTKNLILRELKKSDAKDVAQAMNNWNVHKFVSDLPFPYELVHAETWLAKVAKNAKKEPREHFVFGIEVGGRIVGAIGLHDVKKNHKAELGYWLSESEWGKGVMSESAKLMLTFAFKELGLKRVFARAYANNPGSMRVMGKIGMKFEGIEKKGAIKNGKYVDLHVYAKVK